MRFSATFSLLLAYVAVAPTSVLSLPVGFESTRIQARAPMPSDPPHYSKHDPNNGKKPDYSRKDPHPIPKYRQKDPHKAHPEQQAKGSKFWQNPPRSLEDVELMIRAFEEMGLEAREPTAVERLEARAPMPSDPPPYSKHDPANGKKPDYARKDPHPIPKYRQKDPHKVHPEQQPKGSKFWQNPPRSLDDLEELMERELVEDLE